MRNLILFTVWLLIVGWVFKPVFLGKVPMPLDVMVGGYYPWLDYKWGYPAGIPYKNTSLSDVYSQQIPWRFLAMDKIRQGEMPLWNEYSFAGYPLMANWQSAVLYPLNIFMLIFGNVWGWTGMLVFQVFLAGLLFYLMMRVYTMGKIPAFAGGVVFAFSGFMTTYLEYNTTGQILTWLPLLIIAGKRQKFWHAPWIVYLMLTGGFFQPAFYALVAAGFFWWLEKTGFKRIVWFFGLGIIMSAVQLIPTGELFWNSVRHFDPNIVNYNYGLMPIKLLVTLVAPDFFGNPVTGNYFGFMGYQETTGYAGLVAVVCLPLMFSLRRNKLAVGGWFLTTLGLTLSFDNPLSRFIYTIKVPFISTGYASRNLMFLSFSLAIVTGVGLTKLRNLRVSSLIVGAGLAGLMAGHLISIRMMPEEAATTYWVSLRNMVIPGGILLLTYLISGLKIRSGYKVLFLTAILVFDLTRFSTKFLPFSEARFADLEMPIISFLQTNSKDFRIERDKATLPPNTWTYFGLRTPSGYDPLMPVSFAKLYSIYRQGSLNTQILPRYAETENWNSPLLDLLGVKYILTTKKIRGVIDRNGTDAGYMFDNNRYAQVAMDDVSLVLENKQVLPPEMKYQEFIAVPDDQKALESLANGFDFRRVIILDDEPEMDEDKQEILLVNEAYYPGWKAQVNGEQVRIYKAFGALRAVVVPKGEYNLRFIYLPMTFLLGLGLTVLTAGISGLGLWRQERSG